MAVAQARSVLDVTDVYRIFRSGTTETVALRGASLSVAAGEFVALLGPSGSGKSTLLQLAAGLDDPSAGRVSLGGSPLAGLDDDQRSRLRGHALGMVFQRDNLLPQMTALENVALPARLAGLSPADARKRAGELLAELGLAERSRHRPALLSGGEQQRVALAVALVNKPALLIADEPTGELDAASEVRVLELLDASRRQHGCAVLVVTHSSAVAAHADRVVNIRDGICEAT